uniref:Uncharacterized protein n=1 Tax=Arundo donax TaxID=35708 RepID=A0A0A9GH84_ARUDO
MRETFQFHCLAIPGTGQHALQGQHQVPQLKLQQFQPPPDWYLYQANNGCHGEMNHFLTLLSSR